MCMLSQSFLIHILLLLIDKNVTLVRFWYSIEIQNHQLFVALFHVEKWVLFSQTFQLLVPSIFFEDFKKWILVEL